MALPERPKLDPLPLPESPGLIGGWGEKLEETFLRFVVKTFNTVMTPFWDLRDNTIKFLFQSIEEELKPVIEPILNRIDANENVPPEIRAMTHHLRFSEPITFAAVGSSILVASVMGIAMGLMEPFRRLASQEVDSYAHSARMTPEEAFAALKRGAITEGEFHNHLSDGGWSEELEETWKTLLTPLLGEGDLGRLYLRKEITLPTLRARLEKRGYTSEDIGLILTLLTPLLSEGDLGRLYLRKEITLPTLRAGLEKRGYTSEDIDLIITLFEVIPPLPDIIRMAVREAFTPAIVEEFQLHAELPSEMVDWAEKLGLSQGWAKAYWASHWQLPSLSLGYEMLHRGVITQTQMELLIKAQDVSPFWRDKLLEISYSPYTRVDVRRMYATGVIGQEEVKRTYLDLGYDDERATNLTAFTVALTNETERDLTKTEVLYGYQHGFFGNAETDDLLIGLGYDQTEADYYKARVNYKRWQSLVKETVKFVGMQYVANQIDQSEVYSQLGALNLPAEQMNRHIREWDVKRAAKVKRLTADRLLKFRVAGVISEGDFRSEMSGLGYSERYIGWYLESIEEE